MFTHVEEVEPELLGGEILRHVIWGWGETPVLPYFQPAPHAPQTAIPGVGAAQIEVWRFPPGFPLPGSHESSFGMHANDTIDLIIVLEGELRLKQADDVEVALRRGDVAVQNGTLHSWRNATDEPCLLCFVFLGSIRARDVKTTDS